MAGDSFHAPNFSSKADMYVWLTKQAELQLDGMSSRFTPQANLMLGLANISALCFYELNRRIDAAAPLQDAPVNWFGFYLMEAAGTLALGPFQGRPACTSIRVGKGVCGTAAAERKSLVVADVHDFPGHIACDSASNSEVVVPIIDNEMVVGVIDVDSTQVGCFDEDDARGLEGIARVLAKFLHFPMSRALHANPHLAEANSGPTHHSHVPADYAALHALTLEQVSSAEAANTKDGGSVSIGSSIDVRVETVRGWRFTATNVSRISTDAEQQQLQADIGIHALPEIQYPLNTLTMGKDPDTTPILELSLVRLLESCRDFYLSPAYAAECARADLTLRVADGWASCGYDKFDPKVDWVWRNNFFGLHNTQTQRVVELPPGEEGIRWDVLQDSSLPILFNEAFTLMEDDLHDHGIMHCSLKLRVMPICFFLLFRYFVRVDGHMAYFREVRFFHEFGQTRSCPHTKEPVPHIVLEERFSQMELSPDVEESRRWSVMSEDELARSSTIKQRKLFMVDFTA